jgi:hypothetical protein
MKIGQNCTLKFGDNSSANVELVSIDTYSFMPSDYWFKYQEGESNKQLVHPDFGKEDYIKSEILLPEGLVKMIVTENLEVND